MIFLGFSSLNCKGVTKIEMANFLIARIHFSGNGHNAVFVTITSK